MIGKKILLIAAAALALPAVAWAARPAAPDLVMIPVGFVPIPVFQPVLLPRPRAMLREMALMQERMRTSMAALQRLAIQPIMPAMRIAVPPGDFGFTQVSMVSVSGSGQVCGETVTVAPAPDGRQVVSVRHIGKGCAPLPASMPAPMAPMQTMPEPVQAAPHPPPGALPPPSKLIYAKYRIPPKGAARVQQG